MWLNWMCAVEVDVCGGGGCVRWRWMCAVDLCGVDMCNYFYYHFLIND